MPDPRLSKTPKSRPRRLWPLMLLPIIGLLTGVYLGSDRSPLTFELGRRDPVSSALLGLLAGCGVMIVCASFVLSYRIAQRRFTIGVVLATIAVIAVLLAWARAIMF